MLQCIIKSKTDQKLNIRHHSFSVKNTMLKPSTRSRSVYKVTNLSLLLKSIITPSQSDTTGSLDEYSTQQSEEDLYQHDYAITANIRKQQSMHDLPFHIQEEKTHDHSDDATCTPTTQIRKRVRFVPSLVTQVNDQPRTDDEDWHELQITTDKRNERDGSWCRGKRCIIIAEEVDLDL